MIVKELTQNMNKKEKIVIFVSDYIIILSNTIDHINQHTIKTRRTIL